MSVLLLWLFSLVTPNLCITDLILLQKKALSMENTIMQKSEFSKRQNCLVFANWVTYGLFYTMFRGVVATRKAFDLTSTYICKNHFFIGNVQ